MRNYFDMSIADDCCDIVKPINEILLLRYRWSLNQWYLI